MDVQGRSGCTFEGAEDGAASCSTGGCNGGLECDLRSGTVGGPFFYAR